MNGPQDLHNDQFEQRLMQAMGQISPPAGFADAVMQRAVGDVRPSARVLAMLTRWRTMQFWAAGAVAATLLLGVGVQQIHHHQERAEATRQFQIATQIEQQALDRTRQKLSRSGILLDPQ